MDNKEEPKKRGRKPGPPKRGDEVVRLRDGGMTYVQIAATLGLTSQRAWQIYTKAIKWMKPGQRKPQQRTLRFSGPLMRSSEVLATVRIPEPEVIPASRFNKGQYYVYVLVENNVPLYVGQSRDWASRAMAGDRHASKRGAIERMTHVQLYHCDHKEHANALELRLMLDFKPPFNRQLDYRIVNGIELKPKKKQVKKAQSA